MAPLARRQQVRRQTVGLGPDRLTEILVAIARRYTLHRPMLGRRLRVANWTRLVEGQPG
jgi:hypothetical protein